MYESNVIDCSGLTPDTDSIAKLNRYFQMNTIGDLQFEYSKKGPDHMPIFQTKCKFGGFSFFAEGNNKKEAEKKIRTAIWKFIDQEPINNDIVVKEIYTQTSLDLKPFSNFRQILDKVNPNNPILVVDLENLGEKTIQDTGFAELVSSYKITVICVFARLLPSITGMILIKREDLHRDSADEGIRRIIYYLVDCKGAKKIGLITKDHFGQNIKDSLQETKEDIHLFLNLVDFKAKYQKIL